MRIYLFLFLIVGCVGNEQDFKALYRTNCGKELKGQAPLDCGGKPLLPLILQSKDELVRLNFDVMASFMSLYTPEQLTVKSEQGEPLWALALKAGAEKIYLNLLMVPGGGVQKQEASRIFYTYAPEMFLKFKNYETLMIEPSMEYYLKGNGMNPHSVLPLKSESRDLILEALQHQQSLSQLANLFYETNVLKDAELIRDLEPYLHLSLPFPPVPELTVSLGAMVARKWSFHLRPELFVESDAYLDPLALAVYEGVNVDAFLPFTTRSNALSVAYALLDDSQLKKLERFSFQQLKVIKPHKGFSRIARLSSPSVRRELFRSMNEEANTYLRLRSMVAAINAGDHDKDLINFFSYKLKLFVKIHGTHPSFNRYIGHELKPILDILSSYGQDINEIIPKFHKKLKQKDIMGLSSL